MYHVIRTILFFSVAIWSNEGFSTPIINACGKVFDAQYSFDVAGTAGASDIVWFQKGFIMSTRNNIAMGVTCPVHGVINLANSRYVLSLHNTLLLGSNAEIQDSGIIDGNSLHSISLMNDLVYAGRQLTLKNVTIESRNRVLTLMPNATFMIPDNSYLELKRLTVILRPGSRIVMAGVNSRLLLSQVKLIFEEDYRFDQGSLEIAGETTFAGKHVHDIVYVSSGSLLIKSLSSLIIGAFLTFSYQCTTEDKFVFADKSSCLFLDASSFVAANVPVRLAKGTLRIKNKGVLEALGTEGKIIYTQNVSSPQVLHVQQTPNMLQGKPETGILYATWD